EIAWPDFEQRTVFQGQFCEQRSFTNVAEQLLLGITRTFVVNQKRKLSIRHQALWALVLTAAAFPVFGGEKIKFADPAEKRELPTQALKNEKSTVDILD